MEKLSDGLVNLMDRLEAAVGMAQLPEAETSEVQSECRLHIEEEWRDDEEAFIVGVDLTLGISAYGGEGESPHEFFALLADETSRVLKELRALERGCQEGQWTRRPLSETEA